MNDILKQNGASWDAIANDWFGTTALPTYGRLIPDETELQLFGNLLDKKVLDIGCGSGHSLKYIGDKGASELWGLDISAKQLDNAEKFLNASGYKPKLFQSPMENNPGVPAGYFDIVYSIYAIGWTVDMKATFSLIASYLKPGGTFIFSWDHPLMHCVEPIDGKLIFEGCYFDESLFSFHKGGQLMSLYNRKMSTYINSLAETGFMVEKIVEETDASKLSYEPEFTSKYYSEVKAQKFPLSFIVKARKLKTRSEKIPYDKHSNLRR